MKTWVTSDLHLGHDNVIKFCPLTRGNFRDAEHMNEEFVRVWNDIVSPDDLVYNLGDVAFMSGYEASKVLNRMNGRMILIKGNHDHKQLKDVHFKNRFEEVHDYLEIKVNKTKVVMFHYPIYDHNGAHYGSVMLHGHVHGRCVPIPGRIKDVGYDATGSLVLDLHQLVDEMKEIPRLNFHNT